MKAYHAGCGLVSATRIVALLVRLPDLVSGADRRAQGRGRGASRLAAYYGIRRGIIILVMLGGMGTHAFQAGDTRDVLLPSSGGDFFTTHDYGRGRFERDAAGRVARLV
jgi:hypothetical protein